MEGLTKFKIVCAVILDSYGLYLVYNIGRQINQGIYGYLECSLVLIMFTIALL